MEPWQILVQALGLAALAGPAADVPAAPVQAVTNVEYRPLVAGESAAPGKNRLDLYLPAGRKDFPVVLFVHGGGWRHGDKDFLGFYSDLGKFLARQGLGAVVTNYRLSPAYRHPEHAKDVAAAFAWVCKNIARYGGRPDQVFACGHSAGGHLVSLIATDPTYLKAHGLTPAAIRGVIPISGVYDVTFPGIRLFATAFGEKTDLRKQASPVTHVKGGEPPFLILYADRDYPGCDLLSETFGRALRAKRVPAKVVAVKQRNHFTILMAAVRAGDPVLTELTEFIEAHTQDRPAAAGGAN
jgi:acetyl esterase/lipase